MTGSILGNRVVRKEDPKFLTVGGTYLADLHDERLDGAVYATYVRSAMAHAKIVSIDTSTAAGMPGVVAVFTGTDLGLQQAPSPFNPGVHRTLLATEVVRYVGEPVAVVLSEQPDVGADAAEQVIVDYEPLEALVDMEAALAGTPIYPDAGSNAVFTSSMLGMPPITDDDFFAGCDVVVRHRFLNQRVAPCPLEPRSAAVAWEDGRLVQWLSTQHAHGARDSIKAANGLEDGAVRIIAPDVGGGFGAKIGTYPEDLLLGPPRQGGRPAGPLAREPLREHARPRPRARSDPGRHHRRHQGRHRLGLPPRGAPGLRRLRRGRHDAGPLHDPPHVVGRVPHPEDRVHHVVRRHQHDAHRRLPGRRPARGDRRGRTGHGHVRRSSWAWTPSRCAAAT